MSRAARNKDTGFTNKEELFIQYMADNPRDPDSDAYKSAYNCENMSDKAVYVEANKLKNNPKIALKIQQLRNESAERTKIDSDYIRIRHAEIDQMDVLDIMNDDMTALLPLNEWPKVWRISISGIDISELFEYTDGKKELSGFLKKIKWPDKTKNLELLGKHVDVQAYKERVDHHVSSTLADRLEKAIKRTQNK
ncbi:MAG: terminase small subunit [Methylophaga sp.]|nr:MAG: terminase small subunit [Methylophaga sp.]